MKKLSILILLLVFGCSLSLFSEHVIGNCLPNYFNINISQFGNSDLEQGENEQMIFNIDGTDSVVFDFSQAICSSGQVQVPVFYLSDDDIYAIDIEMKFNPSEFTYNSFTSYQSYLNNSANFNTNDSTLRFTSFSMTPMDNNTPLFALTFDVPSGQLNISSFSLVHTWLNGDLCSYKSINLPPAPPIVPAGITTIALGDSLQLSIVLPSGYTNIWSTGDTTPFIWIFTANTYSVMVTNSLGCTASTFITVTESNPLPVELISFSAKTIKNSIELEWITASEINNDFFTLEHALNPNSWIKVAQLDGAGISTNLNHYTFLHQTPSYGSNFYRLKQTDFNGVYKYSEPIQIYMESDSRSNIKIYPNPSIPGNVQLYIQSPCNDEPGEIVISEMNGREVYHENITMNSSNNDYREIVISGRLQNLASGLYLVTWTCSYSSESVKWIIR